MTLPASGAISLSQVNTELGIASTTAISLNQTNVRTLFGKPSGVISMSDGYGKSNAVLKTIFYTATGSVTTPADFVSFVSVELISNSGSGDTVKGAGGGAYAKSTAVTGMSAGSACYVSLPTTANTLVFFRSGGTTAPATTAQGVAVRNASSQTGGPVTSAVATTVYAGGTGGNGGISGSSGGGGGSAGPSGAGKNGGAGDLFDRFGGGGGGANNGSVGGTADGGAAPGGNGPSGTGGGAGGVGTGAGGNATAGTGGGGGGTGGAGKGGNGATQTIWTQTSNGATAGPGGGGGAGATSAPGVTTSYRGSGGQYGGGLGGGISGGGATGGVGIVVLTYYGTS